MNVINADLGVGFEVVFTFSGPILAADFSPGWFQELDSSLTGLVIVQTDAVTLTVTFDGSPGHGEEYRISPTPSYVPDPQDGFIS